MTQTRLTQELSKVVLPPVQFDGVCLKAHDAAAQATFWGLMLGGPVHDQGDGVFRIDPAPGRPAREIVRTTAAPDLSPDGSRVHFDIRLPGHRPDHLLAAGAQLISTVGADPWYVLADHEQNAICAFPAVDDRPPGIFELVVKCRDAHAQATWWARMLGGQVAIEGEAAAVIGAPDFPWDFFLFDPVPEPKRGANRMHWHVDLRDPDPSFLIAAGARVLRQPTADTPTWVLADPEGNEFCALPS